MCESVTIWVLINILVVSWSDYNTNNLLAGYMGYGNNIKTNIDCITSHAFRAYLRLPNTYSQNNLLWHKGKNLGLQILKSTFKITARQKGNQRS